MSEDKHPTEIVKEFFNKINRTSDFEEENSFLELTGFLKNPPSEELKKELIRKISTNCRVEQLIATLAKHSRKQK